jgi:hypothetical protein
MQITHEEAIQLIQHRADEAVHGIQEKLLKEHLKDCVQCNTYAGEFKEMEFVLQHAMHKHWDRRPAPLSIASLISAKHEWKTRSALLITRTALVSITIFAFIFFGWQATFTNNTSSGNYPGLLPIPTPSTQYTATTSYSLNCREVPYRVQENDTLESIASQHSTSKETLMSLNNLKTEVISLDMELIIPVCDSTPTSTIYPPTFTITPILEPIIYTPG